MQNITDLKVNEYAKIIKIEGDYKVKNRLLELGFVNDALIKVLAISSLKKTFLLEVQNSVIAIRNSTLKDVFICKQ